MTEILEDCLTCCRRTDTFLRISDESDGEDIGTVIASHFWFQTDQYQDRVLCNSCWEKIEDFHKFYCEVKQHWRHGNLSTSAVIKTEAPLLHEGDHQTIFFALEMVKAEIAVQDEDVEKLNDVGQGDIEGFEDGHVFEDEVQEESYSTDDSEEDSSISLAKRCRSVNPISTPPVRSRKKVSFYCKICPRDRCFRLKSFCYKEDLQLHNDLFHSEHLEKKFKCDQCEKAFAFDWQLSGHQKWHKREETSIHCDKCSKFFNTVRELRYHTQRNHAANVSTATNDHQPTASTEISEGSSKKPQVASVRKKVKRPRKTAEEYAQIDELIGRFCPLICDKCGEASKNFDHILQHYRMEHNCKGYALCCGSKFKTRRMLHEHCQRHVNPDAFSCHYCNKSLVDSEALERHIKSVHTRDSEQPFKCEICDNAFPKQYLMEQHMKYHLSMEKKIFTCKECDRSFGTKNSLRIHQETVHDAVSSVVCDICGKGFINKSLFELHRRMHITAEAANMKRQCENCKKWLKHERALGRHLKTCLSSGPVTCDICGKQVSNQPSLIRHKDFYHKERPIFTCSYCGKQFTRPIRHKEHEANHRGEVLYSCEFCPYSCNSNTNMYTHKKKAHQEAWAAKVASRFQK